MNMLQFGYRPQLRMPQPVIGQPQIMQGDAGFDGKMLRKAMARKTVDYNTSALKYLEDRIWKRDYRDERALQADPLYTQQLTLPQDILDNPANCVTTKFIRAALNKDPRPVFCVCWTPDGRRLITGASSGEFTLWNGLTFNFETILQAHNSAVRAMIWSRNEQWMLTGDDKGYIKYWQANMNNVKMFQGHPNEAIRGLSFAPTDCKFTSCSDDRTVRIFDFVTCTEETVLNGHGSDVKCVDWHPFKALIVSGSKDSQQPIILWDPRISGSKKITTLHAHKNTCTDLKWNQFNGNWLISSSRDHLCKLFDIRNLKIEVQSFRGHKKDACTVAWHPIYERFFASGGADGSIFFWQTGAEKELGAMEDAHEGMVWDLSWHPLGHMLVSGSNDRSTRFWTRNRPGDTILDKTDEISMPKAERVTGIIFKNIEIPEMDQQKEGLICLPGLGLEKDMIESGDNEEENDLSPKNLSRQLNSHFNNANHFNNQANTQTQIKRENQTSGADADEDNNKKKAPYSKPIPKEFEKAWKSNKTTVSQSAPLIGNTTNMMLQSQANNAPNLMQISQQTPPCLLQLNTSDSKTQENKQQTSMTKSTSQPIPLMDLMATTLEPVVNKQQNNFKRKLSQDNNTGLIQGEQDIDDRQWPPNKNRQFFQNKNNNNNSNNKNNYNNYNDDNNLNQDYEESYEDNENGNTYNQYSNYNNNFNQNRRGGNTRRGGFSGNNSSYNNNNKKFNDSNPEDENWQSDDNNNDNDQYEDYNNGNSNQNNYNSINSNRNRGNNSNNNNIRNNRNMNNRGGGSFNNSGNNKSWSNNNNNYMNDEGNDVNNSNDNYDNNYENNNNNRLKNNRRGGFNNNNNSNNQRRGYYNNNNNNMVSDNNS